MATIIHGPSTAMILSFLLSAVNSYLRMNVEMVGLVKYFAFRVVVVEKKSFLHSEKPAEE